MSDIPIIVPSLGESITQATVGRWLKQIGDYVELDETIVELETDKVTLEINASTAGVLKEMLFVKGQVAKIGDTLGRINPKALPQKATNKKAESLAILSTMIPLEDLSPAVEKWVKEYDLNPAEMVGTGKHGRLTKTDVIDFLETSRVGASRTETKLGSDRLEKRVPLSTLRQRIAERLKQAQNTAAILTTFNEVDLTAVQSLRQRYKDQFEKKYGIKLGLMSFFVKAVTQALHDIPILNSQIESNEIVHKNYQDVGIAVASPQGLVVPIIRDANKLNFAEIEKTITDFGERASSNKLTLEDLSGGTFTITNGGVFGSLLSTPILNPPQSGILGLHKIQDRPVVINGRVEIRPMMYLALSYDHRLIDGKEAVSFLVNLKDYLENPGKVLLEL
jgi:2-oxoglutarate dehydrogenase E2 component (dihydrolipoamide succinyltransferase)